MSCEKLGCGDTPCAPCAERRAQKERLGAVMSFNPAAAFADAASMFGVPRPLAEAAASTAIGLSTPVSAEDAAAFARLTDLAAQLQAVAFTSGAPPSHARLLAEYGSFVRLWNAAQRDPNKLRALIAKMENALQSAQSAASAGGGERPVLHFPRRKGFVRKHAVPLAVGGGLVLLGTAVAVLK